MGQPTGAMQITAILLVLGPCSRSTLTARASPLFTLSLGRAMGLTQRGAWSCPATRSMGQRRQRAPVLMVLGPCSRSTPTARASPHFTSLGLTGVLGPIHVEDRCPSDCLCAS